MIATRPSAQSIPALSAAVKVAAGGFTCTGRLTSSGRSSTCTRRPGGTARRRVSSSGAPGKPRVWCRWRSSPTAHRPTQGPRFAVAGRLAPRRAVREQPGRVRPRAAEAVAAPDARDQDHDRAAGARRRSRVRAEPAPRPLRDRRRPTPQPSTRHRVRPTSNGSLLAVSGETPASHTPRSANATVSMRSCRPGRSLTLNATGRECLWSDLSAVGLGGIAAAGTGGVSR
jgi:hypothetical protein